MKRRRKNGTALAAAIIATPVGLAGGVYWALLSNVYHPQGGWYILGFILLGMVGPLLGLMGGMLAFGWHRSGWVLLALACVCAAALVPLSCVYAGEFRVVGEVFPIICAADFGACRRARLRAPARRRSARGRGRGGRRGRITAGAAACRQGAASLFALLKKHPRHGRSQSPAQGAFFCNSITNFLQVRGIP